MGLPTSPPPLRSPEDNHATLLISWFCTISALVIILFRVVGRFTRAGTLLSEDKYMCWAILPLLIRQGLVHVVLLYGTNNTTTQGISLEAAYHRSIGSRCVLAARIFYAMFIWISKLTVSEFLKRLTSSTWNGRYELVLKTIRAFLVVTFIGVVISTLSECQPFDHYWQVVPDPGPECRTAYPQLFVMGICDIITDTVLIVFPLSVLLRSNLSFSRKVSTSMLYSLSALLIAIAAYRIPAIVSVHGRQQRRSLWASIEILASAAVANAVIIGSYLRDRGVKKQKFRSESANRHNSTVDKPSFNRRVTREQWGADSDEDLFRSTLTGRMTSGSMTSNGDFSPVTPHPNDGFMSRGFHFNDPYVSTSSSDDVSRICKGKEHEVVPSHPSEALSMDDAGGLLPIDTVQDRNDEEWQSPTDSVVMDFASADRREGLRLPGDQEPTTRLQVLSMDGKAVRRVPDLEIELHDAGGLLV